jgi:hypothetical protein
MPQEIFQKCAATVKTLFCKLENNKMGLREIYGNVLTACSKLYCSLDIIRMIKEDETVTACSTHGTEEECKQGFSWKT